MEAALPRVEARSAGLADAVSTIVSQKAEVSERLIAVINTLSENGAVMESRFTFGALRGLMTLYKEGYVDENTFRRLLRQEIARLLKRKFLRTIWDDPRVLWNALKTD